MRGWHSGLLDYTGALILRNFRMFLFGKHSARLFLPRGFESGSDCVLKLSRISKVHFVRVILAARRFGFDRQTGEQHHRT